MKALGARRSDVLIQFLAEALAITAGGGILGILIAYIISASVGTITLYSAIAENAESGDIHLVISLSSILLSTLILGGVGLISGIVPAIRASRLNPIEACATNRWESYVLALTLFPVGYLFQACAMCLGSQSRARESA